MLSDIQEMAKMSIIQGPSIPRVTQEEVIVQNEQTASTLQSVVCPVCLLVLTLPHWICEGCDNAFCKSCMEDWWRKNPKTCIFKCQNPNFKIVKRSNTYQAIMDILKVNCKYCGDHVPISTISTHDDKTCPKKPIACQLEGCLKEIARELMAEHLKTCSFRRQDCRFCGQSFFIGQIETHEKEGCSLRIVACQNEGCLGWFQFKVFAEHQAQCPFKKLECQWCHSFFISSQIDKHYDQCQKRQFHCQWCNQLFFAADFKSHSNQCLERRAVCQLCGQSIKQIESKDHRTDCVFKEMVALKTSHYRLSEQNVKLKLKVHELEITLEETIRNQHEATVNSLIKVKEEERREYQRDLLRIRNSIQSLRKCRNEELAQHLKKLHLSTSLCVVCSTIRKKLQDELEPLLRMQEETILKIKQLQRVENATKKSVIRFKDN